MITDTIKQLGAEFHHAADGVGEALQRLERARADRLAFLRRCSKDSTARLATLKEELRTLPEQIAKWDAEAARLESQTAEDLLRQALEPVREATRTPIPVWHCPACKIEIELGETFGHCAQCGKPLEPNPRDAAIPEPYRAGLPPERLRKVWAEWEDQEGHVVTFKDDLYHWTHWPPNTPIKRIMDHAWIGMKLRPLGNTHAYVEAMADEAEKPTLLDLIKLPLGTVCEATGQIARGSHVILPGERFAFAGSSTEFLARVRVIERDESFDVPTVVYARVVEVPR